MEKEEELRNWFVYILENDDNEKTYLGVTNNYERRIRQHNGELKGGARSTRMGKGDGSWVLKILIPNVTKRQSLSIERTLKNRRRCGKGKSPLMRRIYILNMVYPNMEHLSFD